MGLGGKHSDMNVHTTACQVLGPSTLKGVAPSSMHICAIVNSYAHVHAPSPAVPGFMAHEWANAHLSMAFLLL